MINETKLSWLQSADQAFHKACRGETILHLWRISRLSHSIILRSAWQRRMLEYFEGSQR